MPDPSFDVDLNGDSAPGRTLVVGLSNVAMSSLTAVDYLVRRHDCEQIGHIVPEEFPAIAPFANGEPRHHTRLYADSEIDATILVGELFVPVPAAARFTDALLEWATDNGVEEIVVPYGVPFPHGPDEHDVFYVATPEYRERRLDGSDVQPLAGGVLDGVAGELVTRSLDASSPPVGVLTTPSHPPGPDVDAAMLLLEALQRCYDFSVDMTELEQLSDEMKRYYAQLADRLEVLGDADQSIGSTDYPEDRMYM